jgi:molecular chaperone DnaK
MRQPPVGIDLGTTNSALAVINPAGRPEIVPNQEGNRTTPSAVYFEEGGDVVIGSSALSAVQFDQARVVLRVKRRMGDPGWTVQANGRGWSATDVSAQILAKVKDDAENTVGPIRHAVITVPAYFDEVRRKATMDAAAQAGLEALGIINEPTAAAVAYANALGKQGRLVVYDFGGGTFDVSIVDVKGPDDVEVIASEGDHELGGSDLDDALARHYAQQLRAQGAEAAEGTPDWMMLVSGAQRDKEALSRLKKIRGRAQCGSTLINIELDRATFEQLIRDHIIRTQMLVENALACASLAPAQIDDVVLIGGSTRVPAVSDMLEKMFGKKPVAPVNVDEAVALGAALQAGVIMARRGLIRDTPAAEQLKRVAIQDVASHSYGTFAVTNHHGTPRLRNNKLILKNTRIPVSVTKTYYTMHRGQTVIDCAVTQGEDEDPEFVNVIKQDELRLPPDLPDGSPIDITYEYDANMHMKCTFLERSSGYRKEFILDRSGRSSAEPSPAAAGDEADEADFDDLKL